MCLNWQGVEVSDYNCWLAESWKLFMLYSEDVEVGQCKLSAFWDGASLFSVLVICDESTECQCCENH